MRLALALKAVEVVEGQVEAIKTVGGGERCMKGLGEQEKEVTTEFSLLRSRLESERKRLTEELEQLTASVRPPEERREGSPFGKREEATEGFELEKRLALEKHTRELLAEVEHTLDKFEEGNLRLM